MIPLSFTPVSDAEFRLLAEGGALVRRKGDQVASPSLAPCLQLHSFYLFLQAGVWGAKPELHLSYAAYHDKAENFGLNSLTLSQKVGPQESIEDEIEKVWYDGCCVMKNFIYSWQTLVTTNS
jgi:hypothetical protein